MISLTRKFVFHPLLRGSFASLALVALSICAVAQERAMVQASFTNNAQPVKIDVLVGQSRVIDLDEQYERVSISDPKIAETVPITERQILVNGLTFGQVNLVVWSKAKFKGEPARMLVFDIYVQVNLSLIDNQIKILFPKENIQLSQANNSVVISGSVTQPALVDQVQKIIEAAGLKTTNLLKAPVLDAAQVQLQIRVAEVNRQVLREIATAYGIANNVLPAFISSGGPGTLDSAKLTYGQASSALNFTVGSALNLFLGNANGSAATQGFIRALYSRGALRDLAEPNLIAMNGQKASFLAGGEFPIPVIQSVTNGQSAITIIFKEFGVKLDFTPTIIDENHIRLELAPEVSSLDFSSGVNVQSLVIPGLRVRRAKTVLELRDGQSFALAGLIDNQERVNLSKIPLLGDIPWLGELFKSRSFQRNETELLLLATVKLVEPLNPDQIPRLPGVSELKPVNSTAPQNTPASSVEGQSGHSLERKSGDAENQVKARPSTGGKAPTIAERAAATTLTPAVTPVAVEANVPTTVSVPAGDSSATPAGNVASPATTIAPVGPTGPALPSGQAGQAAQTGQPNSAKPEAKPQKQ